MTLHLKGSVGDAEWAYCEHCKREVELLPRGYLAGHTTHKGVRWSEVACKGSYQRPSPPPE